MNLTFNQKALPFLSALLGILALMLQLGLQLWGMDEKGLLITAHPLTLALLAATLLAFLAAGAVLRKTPNTCRHTPDPSAAAAIGCFALAGGITVAVISTLSTQARLDQICSLCGILSVPALIILGLKRFSGKQPFFLLHGLVCLYLMLHTVSHYQIWSSQPQWIHWLFPMAASVLLTLFSYQQTASDVSLGSLRLLRTFGLLAVFFCFGAVARENSMLYLGGALWALTNSGSPVCTAPKDDDHASA